MADVRVLTKMQQARSRFLLTNAFFSALLMSTPMVAANVKTAGTDMFKIYYSEAFINSLDMDTIIFVLAHELLHIVFKHGLRRGGRRHDLFNIACDHVVNLALEAAGFKIWDKAYCDKRFKGMGAEQVYDILLKEEQERRAKEPEPEEGDEDTETRDGDKDGEEGKGPTRKGKNPGKEKGEEEGGAGGDDAGEGDEGAGEGSGEGDEGADEQGGGGKGGRPPKQRGPGEGYGRGGRDTPLDGDLMDPGQLTEEQKQELEGQIARRVAQAATQARMQGKMTADLEIIIDGVLHPEQPWESLLAPFMTTVVKSRESWRRGNRRFLHRGIYLPTRHGRAMGELVIIGDTSGSMMYGRVFERVAAEMNYIKSIVKPTLIRVIWADDTDCKLMETFEPNDEIELHPKGCGGTDMRKPIKFVEQFDPMVVVLITDCYTDWPDRPTPFPLLVLSTTNEVAPNWATTIKVTV